MADSKMFAKVAAQLRERINGRTAAVRSGETTDQEYQETAFYDFCYMNEETFLAALDLAANLNETIERRLKHADFVGRGDAFLELLHLKRELESA